MRVCAPSRKLLNVTSGLSSLHPPPPRSPSLPTSRHDGACAVLRMHEGRAATATPRGWPRRMRGRGRGGGGEPGALKGAAPGKGAVLPSVGGPGGTWGARWSLRG